MATKIPSISFLSSVSFFSKVSENSLKHLDSVLIKKEFSRRDIIFKKGEPGDVMYIIKEGEIKIHDEHHIFHIALPGDCLGEYALIDQKERSATATCTEDSTLLLLKQEDFLHLIQTDLGFSKGVLSVMIERHRHLDQMQMELAKSKHDLEISNAKFQGLINGAMDAIIMISEDFKIQMTNPSANIMIENMDAIHRNLLFFLDEPSAQFLEDEINAANNEKNKFKKFLTQPITVIGSNETVSIHEVTLSKIEDEKGLLYLIIFRNIEDKIKTEHTIKLLTKKTEYLEAELQEKSNNHGITAKHETMLQVLRQIDQVATTDATVLITGETGTGKELVAKAIHQASFRFDKPFIRINCGAIPSNLIESELFGHVKGAFTGASTDRKGRFELAHSGTLFLDEIGELPLDLQPKLLRVIQEGEFEPLGSSKTIKVDVRILAATHRDLRKRAEKGTFREDLFYRLNVFPIHIPPLKERGNDVCDIANDMVANFCKKLNKPLIQFSESDINLLISYQWPGNVRELQNLMERAVIISQEGQVNLSSIIPSIGQNEIKSEAIPDNPIWTASQLTDFEKENIVKALEKTNWRISGKNGAAALLQLPPTTLSSKIKALKITKP
ncbi:sigma 54-interacting transcriptional regulator [Mangrovimonas sp. CR14]|uniref:sigma 54-interacting transcriptional regulator n=1 Tax=Mangrovimonas sp. CR14 TaxID=2706120 RepID=UPI00142430B5|nr:sigma 54-interacting transcriptional regulator [Mangrovimonas sp. CR14]